MILSVTFQFKIFLVSIIIGVLIGVSYDMLKVFRNFIVHNKILIDIEDSIFWIFTSILVFFVSLYQNDGEVRLFFIFGILLSMTLYVLTISKVIQHIVIKIINITLIPIKLILNFINYIKKLLQMNKLYVKIYNIAHKKGAKDEEI